MVVGSRYITIRVDVDTGEYDIKPSEGVKEEKSSKEEIEEIKKSKPYKRVGEIIQTNQSPGCVYWDGLSWVKWC